LENFDWRYAPTEEKIEALRRRFPTEPCCDEALTRKMRGRRGPPYHPQAIDSVRERLHSFIAKRVDGKPRIDNVRTVAGGSSKEQFAFDLTIEDGKSAPQSQRLIVRFETPESPVTTHRLREFQILQAMQGWVPAPKPYWVDPQGKELGQPALIFEFCRGVSRPPTGTKTAGPQQGYDDRITRLLAPQFVNLLGRMAITPCEGKDLSAFVMPKAGTNEAPLMGIDHWERVWEEDRVEAVPLMSFTTRWLRDNAPVADRISPVHGDYRTGQFLFDVETGEITAILDWEMIRFGDRHEDLTYNMIPTLGSPDAEGRDMISGFYYEDEYFARYEAASGLPVDRNRVAYYQIYNFWRLFIITYASSHRCVINRKTHHDTLAGLSSMTSACLLSYMEKHLRKVM
jgi:aminoglycoside phosphotransferase (APT) family kinase protein